MRSPKKGRTVRELVRTLRDEWPIVKAELRNALKERRRIERAGWFN